MIINLISVYIKEMENKSNVEIERFKDLLRHHHYSAAFIFYLLAKLQSLESITFLEINQLIQKQSSLLIQYFANNSDQLHLLQNKNPLCLESIRDFMNKVFRGVHRKYGKNVHEFKEGLKKTCENLVKIMNASTQQTADNAYGFLLEKNFTHILVYNYSKSIAVALKKMSKFLGNNVEIVVCQCGNTPEGKKLYQQLRLENVNCNLINDTEIAFYVKEVDCILMGAEVVLENGSILNRVGAHMLALCALQAHKPVIVFSESYKFLKRIFLTEHDIPNHSRQEEKEKAILVDLVERNFISLFCTDIGLLGPEAIPHKMATLNN